MGLEALTGLGLVRDVMGLEGGKIFHFPARSVHFLLLPERGLTMRNPRLEVVPHRGVALKGHGRLLREQEGFGGHEGLDLVLDVIGVRGGSQVHVGCGARVLHGLVDFGEEDGPMLETVPEFRVALEGHVGGHLERLWFVAFGMLTWQALVVFAVCGEILERLVTRFVFFRLFYVPGLHRVWYV